MVIYLIPITYGIGSLFAVVLSILAVFSIAESIKTAVWCACFAIITSSIMQCIYLLRTIRKHKKKRIQMYHDDVDVVNNTIGFIIVSSNIIFVSTSLFAGVASANIFAEFFWFVLWFGFMLVSFLYSCVYYLIINSYYPRICENVNQYIAKNQKQ